MSQVNDFWTSETTDFWTSRNVKSMNIPQSQRRFPKVLGNSSDLLMAFLNIFTVSAIGKIEHHRQQSQSTSIKLCDGHASSLNMIHLH